MKRRDFMAGVGASILLALSKSNSQVPAQRPRLLISNTDAFTGLALLKTRYASGMRPSEDTEWVGSLVATNPARQFCGEGPGRDARRPHHQGGEAFAFVG
jgi:hypothetical protein